MIFNRKPIFLYVVALMLVCFFQSCFPKGKVLGVLNRTSVKNAPKDAFVFANEIRITPGIVAKDEQNRLQSELNGYWDDSVKAREVQQFGVFYRIKNPQHFDTFALERSRIFMQSYLQSQGYYNAVLRDTFRIDTFRAGRPKQQIRAIPVMYVNPGKRLNIDSVAYNFIDTIRPSSSDSVLQQLAIQKSNESLLQKGNPYSKQIIGQELDRLVTWFRQNGYYRLNRENLVAYVDTTDQLIDDLTIDPFELTRRIAQAAERRRQNPTADVEIMQATKVKEIAFDSTVVTRYHFGNITYYPATGGAELPDSLLRNNLLNTRDTGFITMKFPGAESNVHFKPLIRHTFFKKGELYNERLFFRTINTLNQLGPWSQIEIRDSIRQDTVDFHVFLTPNRRRNFKTAVELTRSTGDFIGSNNLFGVGGNATLAHRNLFRSAVQSAVSARAGVEFNLEPKQELIQTVQGGLGLSFVLPNSVVISEKRQRDLDAARTVINFNASYTERRSFFRLRSLTASYGEEWVNRNKIWAVRLPNIELYSLDVLPLLDTAFKTNPFLRTAFNTGSVLSGILTFNSTWPGRKNPSNSHFFRSGIEYAGLFFPWVIPALEKNLFHYIKAETEFIYKTQKIKTTHVYRGFIGAGYNLINDPIRGKSLPFFKQFVAGGPNSMRAWGLRQLGLGSSKLSDTSKTFRDRFGDLHIEFNYEYRFLLADVGGAKFSSAIFFDAGNIWNIKPDPTNPAGTFTFRRFVDDLAIAGGVGLLRVNVANFIFRVDFALKLKDPAIRENNGLLNLRKFSWKNENDRNVYALQIGIGLPF